MWFLPLSFFGYQFILRLWPSLMMQQIMLQFSIDATAFGLLASLYYFGYAGMQIPIAILLDRFGPRYIMFLCALVCGLATLMFCFTNNWYLAMLSRFLVGAGSAVGFLGTSKVISQWFPKSQYARMIGFSFTFGLMGAIYGGKPVSLLVEQHSWQTVAIFLAGLSIFIGLMIFLILRSPSKNEDSLNTESFKLSDFRELLSSKTIWFLGISNLLMVGSLEGFADVWGVPYLMTAHGLLKGDSAQLISFIFIGMLFGGPLLALLSSRIGNYSVIALCGMGMSVIFTLFIYGLNYSWLTFAILFFCVGIMCCYQVIVFAAGSDLVKPHLLGVIVAFLNCINMLGGSFFHSTIGLLMDSYWSGTMGSDGIKLYSLDSFNHALLMVPISALVGTLIVGCIGYVATCKKKIVYH